VRGGFLYYSLWALAFVVGLPLAAVLSFILWFWIYYSWHFEDAATRKAIYADAQILIAQAPQNDAADPPALTPGGVPIPRHVEQFPPHFSERKSLTALKPLFVSVNEDGAYITMRMGFDKSGYFVPRKGKPLKSPEALPTSYQPLGDGVWWFHYHD
jgi:hypothetical protein